MRKTGLASDDVTSGRAHDEPPREATDRTGVTSETRVYTYVFRSVTGQLMNSVSRHVIKLIRLINAP